MVGLTGVEQERVDADGLYVGGVEQPVSTAEAAVLDVADIVEEVRRLGEDVRQFLLCQVVMHRYLEREIGS